MTEQQRTKALELVERRMSGEKITFDVICEECAGFSPDPIILLMLHIAPAARWHRGYIMASDEFVRVQSGEPFVIGDDEMCAALAMYQELTGIEFVPAARRGATPIF
jgi:hypothetical protein